MKTQQITGIVLILSSIVAAGWFYLSNQRLQKELDTFQATTQWLNMKNLADEFFIQGDHQQALRLYQKLDSINNDSLEAKRMNVLPNVSSTDSNKLEVLSRKLQLTTALLQEYKERDKIISTEIVDQGIDTEEEFKQEILSLNQKLLAAQKEIEGLKTNRGVIRFTSTKNSTVTYIGDLRNGKANGNGFGLWNTGSSYEGSWQNNLRHGEGVFLWADGEKYEGDYANDQRQGFGVYIAKAGKYEGQWLNDMRHGEGRLFEANGKLKVHGIWDKDKLIKTLK